MGWFFVTIGKHLIQIRKTTIQGTKKEKSQKIVP
jgi:hypothetical protein